MFILINKKTDSLSLDSLKRIDLSDYYFFYSNSEIEQIFKDERYFIYQKGIPSFSEYDFNAFIKGFEKSKSGFSWKKGSYLIFIYDKFSKSAYIFRDFWGSTPVYYSTSPIIISDSLTDIITLCNSSEINRASVCEYLSSSYIAGNETLFERIFALLQMHSLELKGMNISVFQNLNFPEIAKTNSYNEIAAELENLIDNSINSLHSTINDLSKFFISLSGGTDSSLLVSKINEIYDSNDYVCGTVDYENWPKRDIEYYNIVMKKFSPKGHIEVIDNNRYAESLKYLLLKSGYIYHTFSPSFYSLASSIKKLFPETSYHINGTGPDEALFGFEKATFDEMMSYNNIPKEDWTDILLKKLDSFYTNPETVYDCVNEKYKYDMFAGRKKIAEKIIHSCDSFVEFQRRYAFLTITDHHIRMLHHISLINGYETIYPYCTDEIFELFFKMPFSIMNSSLTNKICLKQILEKYFNKDFVYRPKIGFHAPSRIYFKEKAGMRNLIDNINFSDFDEIVDTERVAEEINLRISKNDAPMDYFLWTLTNMGLFLNNYKNSLIKKTNWVEISQKALSSISPPCGFRFEIIDETHSDSIIKWRNDPEINRNFIKRTRFTNETQSNFLKNYKELDRIDLVLIYNQTGKPAGVFSIANLSANPEIGKLLGDKNFHGKGIAKKATVALIEFAFLFLNLKTVYATTQKTNSVNIELNKKIGFTISDEKVIDDIEYYVMKLESHDFLCAESLE